jgi:hypothetical protein
MKKVVVSSLISVFILILIAGGFFYFQKIRSENSNVFDTVPADVSWLISCDPSSGILRQIANTSFFSGADSVDVMDEWKVNLLELDSIAVNTDGLPAIFKDQPLLVSGHVTGTGRFSTLYLARIKNTSANHILRLLQKVLVTDQRPGGRNFNGADIREFLKEDGSVRFAYVISKGIFIGSTSPFLVEDALRQQRSERIKSPASRLDPMLRDAKHNTVLAIRYEGFEPWIQTQLLRDVVNLNVVKRLGDWSVMRFEVNTNQLKLNGTTTLNDTTSFLKLFVNQEPVERKLPAYLLNRTVGFVSWGFSQPQDFSKDLGRMIDPPLHQEWEGMKTDSLRMQFSNWIGNEIAVAALQPIGGQSGLVWCALATLKHPDSCIASLKNISFAVSSGKRGSAEERYNGAVIRHIPGNGLLPMIYGTSFGKINRFYYTVLDSVLLITGQVSVLRAYINDYRLGNLLESIPAYIAMNKSMPGTSGLFFYASVPSSVKYFSELTSQPMNQWIRGNSNHLKNWNGLMYSVQHRNGVLKTEGSLGYMPALAKAPEVNWEIKTDTLILAGPFYPGKGQLVFVQDVNLVLHAFNLNGNAVFTRQLESVVRSNVEITDTDADNNYEYLFNTVSFVYRLTAEGQNVKGYPLRLPAAASAGLALAVWPDSSVQYFIPCLHMKLAGYNLSGKPAEGYSPFRLREVSRFSPVVMTNRNALFVRGEGQTGYLVGRSGSIIHTVKQEVNPVVNEAVFADSLAAGGYSWITPDGRLVRIGRDGLADEMKALGNGDSISGALQIELNGDTISDWIFTSESGLRGISAEGISLFVYTSEYPLSNPVLVKAGSKMWFAASDGSRAYVFNRNGSLVEGFPVQATAVPVFFPAENGFRMIYRVNGSRLRMMGVGE